MGRRRTYKRRSRPKPGPPKNEQIKHEVVHVIDPEGESLGEMPTKQALEEARKRGLDLIEIVPKAKPPVTKIADYGKHRYQQQKKERKRKAGSQESEVKGIRIGLGTSRHDINFKVKQASKFLQQNHKIRLEMKLRGRERAHQKLAREKIQQFITAVPEETVIEQTPQKSHWGLTTVFRRK